MIRGVGVLRILAAVELSEWRCRLLAVRGGRRSAAEPERRKVLGCVIDSAGGASLTVFRGVVFARGSESR
jgi:hypothetical protein